MKRNRRRALTILSAVGAALATFGIAPSIICWFGLEEAAVGVVAVLASLLHAVLNEASTMWSERSRWNDALQYLIEIRTAIDGDDLETLPRDKMLRQLRILAEASPGGLSPEGRGLESALHRIPDTQRWPSVDDLSMLSTRLRRFTEEISR